MTFNEIVEFWASGQAWSFAQVGQFIVYGLLYEIWVHFLGGPLRTLLLWGLYWGR